METFIGFVLYLYTTAGKIERTDPPPKGKERWVCKQGKLKLKTIDGKLYPVEVLDE